MLSTALSWGSRVADMYKECVPEKIGVILLGVDVGQNHRAKLRW